MKSHLRIGDLIEAPSVQTVIRLEESHTRPEEIVKSFVFTDDVASHFAVLSDALLKDQGQGYFLQGDFGSGKSHFLAAVIAWLRGQAYGEQLSTQHGGLRRVNASGRRFLPVDISLVNYRASRPLERILVESIEAELHREKVFARLTPLSQFLGYFQSVLADNALAADFAAQAGLLEKQPPNADLTRTVSLFLDTHPRLAYTEGIRFLKRIGLNAPEILVEERYETFERAIKAVSDASFNGLVLIIDELSEFFRSKPDARALNEDARTLQFLGELTLSHPVWVIAAVQESIEQTGDISQLTFRKIKDRFPVKFHLSTLHIKALIEKRLVRRKPAAPMELQEIYRYLKQQFHSFTWEFSDFNAYYPVHPLTIELLEGLSDLFSAHRGIVDFIHCRLAGDETRQIKGILDHPAYQLLGPDSIYDHFSSRMAEFSSLHIFPKHIVPHLDEIISREIDDPEDQALARRIVRILVLYKLHPTAETPPVKLITELVSCALSQHDPSLNVEFVSEALLDVLVKNSRFLVKHPSKTHDPLDAVYTVVTQDDPSKSLKAKISQRIQEIPIDDSRLLTDPLSILPVTDSWPGNGLMHPGITRYITWRQSSRKAFICFLLPQFSAEPLQGQLEKISVAEKITIPLAMGELDFAVVISLGKTAFREPHTAIWEIPAKIDEKELKILREFLATKQVTSELRPSNPADAALIPLAKEAIDKLEPAAFQAALTVFYSGNFTDQRLKLEPVIRRLKRFERLLDIAGEGILEDRYPGFKEIAPRKVTPSPRLYQRLLDEFVSPGSLTLRKAHSLGLNDAIEGLATPLGLVELRSGSYILSPDPEAHPLIAEVFSHIRSTGQTNLTECLSSLKTGRFGAPEDAACFLISALAFGGLLTLLKKGRALPLEFIQLISVKEADAIAPGEITGKHDRDTLMTECGFLSTSEGWEVFGLKQQREAWQEVVKFRNWGLETVTDIEKRLSVIADFSAFERFDIPGLRSKLNTLSALANEIKASYAAREGLERFLKAWRGYGVNGADVDFLKKLRHFFIHHAEQFVFINHYIRHTAVDIACSAEKSIAELRKDFIHLLDDPGKLVLEEDVSILARAFERFRTVYSEFYIEKHTGFYKSFEKRPLSRFAKRAHALLKRLYSIEMLDRPQGLEGLFKEIEGSRAKNCNRNIPEELLRFPVCGCGFIPETDEEIPQQADPEERIEGFLEAYMGILKAAPVREAISARLFALADSNPAAVKRLRSFASLLEGESPPAVALLDLLDDETASEISKSLSGKVVVRKRRLKDLFTGLGGRRLSADQVYQTVRQWIGEPEENTVIAVEDDGMASPAESGLPLPRVSWWQTLHPDVFKSSDTANIREMETALEKEFPATSLRKSFSTLDTGSLYRFIRNEPFHASAIREAWLLFTDRIISGSPFPNEEADAPHAAHSRLIDPEMARQTEGRLTLLKQMVKFSKSAFPHKLRVRLPLSGLLVDSWATAQLRECVLGKIRETTDAGEEWLSVIPPLVPMTLSDHPLVMILDGMSPDVWLEILESQLFRQDGVEGFWYRLEVPPQTPSSISSLFGFSGDAIDELGAKGIPYHRVKGNEKHGLAELLPEFSPEKAAVIHVSLVDAGAHSTLLRLSEMPGAVLRFLIAELPRLFAICDHQRRRFVLTTDHGLTLSGRGLFHGQGGVYERTVFRWERKGRGIKKELQNVPS